MFGHIQTLAHEEVKGIEDAGGKADLFQVGETLSENALSKMHAKPKETGLPTIDQNKLAEYDGFICGVPTRYGNMPAQWKTFWDHTAGQWVKGGYQGKYVGVFVSSGTLGGGQESTALAMMSTFAHHGLIFVPLGYKNAGADIQNLDEVHGGSPWGAGTFSAGDGSRQVSPLELAIARKQGQTFYETLLKVKFD